VPSLDQYRGDITVNKKTQCLLACLCLGLTACATKKLQLMGAVTPLADGSYKSFVKAQDEAAAMKILTHDGNAICERDGRTRFVVVSQENSKKDAPDVKTDNKFLDAAVALSSAGRGLRNEASFESATIFRCQ
jgi:hypothetical protein